MEWTREIAIAVIRAGDSTIERLETQTGQLGSWEMDIAANHPARAGFRASSRRGISDDSGFGLAPLFSRGLQSRTIRPVLRFFRRPSFQKQRPGNPKLSACAGCLLAVTALAAGPLSAAEPDRVAILLREPTLKALEDPLHTYLRDVEERFPAKLQIVPGPWKTPEEVRTSIKDLHEKQRISGVILVGAMPMHRFHMHEFANPNPLYYEDFDLKFIDRNSDGVADGYEGEPRLKVWVANLRCSVNANDDDIETLKRFFAKTHAYYQAEKAVEPRALALSASDWPEGGTWFKDQVGGKLVGKDAITVLENKACTLKSAEKALNGQDHTLTYIQVHSDWNAQSMEDGDLGAEQVAGFKKGSLITINHGCSTANWMHNEAEGTRPNMAMSYVFGRNIGQAVIAQVRTGMVYDQEVLYEGLAGGDCIGKAYFNTKQRAELRFMKGDHVPGDIVSGILMIGNPFVRIGAARGR